MIEKLKYNKRKIFLGLLCLLLSFLPVKILYGICLLLQPEELEYTLNGETAAISYLDINTTYSLEGEIEMYPKVIIGPNNFEFYEDAREYIYSLEEVRSEECIKGDNYVATLRFYINVPGNIPYALILPGEFCEYLFFANREAPNYTKTFKSENPVFPFPSYIEIPFSDSGEYEIIMYVLTPVNSVESTGSSILFGSKDQIKKIYNYMVVTAVILAAVIIMTIIFCLTQYIAMKRDKILTSFVILLLTMLIRVLFKDDVIIMQFLPDLGYQVGTIFKGIYVSLFLIALVNYERNLFPGLFEKKPALICLGLQLIPFINTLALGQIEILNKLSFLAEACVYIICIQVYIKAHLKKRPYSKLFGAALILCVSGEAVDMLTVNLAVPSRYSYVPGYACLIFLEIFVLAHRYAEQEKSERYYSEELEKNLEAIRDSENAFLNAQMKPHFLYNTLNTIADLCVTDSEKAKSLIKSLEDYCQLILSIDNMEKTVPLSKEMELVGAYTSIEKERFPSIKFYTDFPVRMPKIYIPPLTLQPLIENAIKHGVRKADRPGVITLRIRDSFDEVTFYVSDNGVGMDEEIIKNLFKEPKENKSIGVYNIDTRLKNLYHKGLNVESTPNLGSSISFTIPK